VVIRSLTVHHPLASEQRSRQVIDFEEASARLQTGLHQCRKMVASYRTLLSGDDQTPASPHNPA
jgi:hypothetical protein